ncbi:MAG: response regulator [Ruminococcus sp.]|jgi:signal transduction histidine kinase/CheY-like chemotaxis protein|nr:response regulator [Ruminococcus sp.]
METLSDLENANQELTAANKALAAENKALIAENQALAAANKTLKLDLRSISREFTAQKRHLHVMEMSSKSRDFMYRSQILNNERQRRFLTNFMNSSQNFMLFLDKDLSIAFISATLLSYIDVEYETGIIGMNVSDFYKQYFDSEHTEKILSAIETVSQSMRPIDHNITLAEDNNERYYQATCSPMSDEDKNFCGIIIIYYDETDILNSMNQAVEANNAKSRFLATMSHEIRTPMNAIIGISDIEIAKASDRKTITAFEMISRSAQSLLNIINDILDLSKAETGKLEILPGKFDFASFLSDTIQLNITRVGSKQIVFNLYLDGDIPDTLIGDEMRIKQILNNVLSNAFKYTEAGSVKLYVKADITGEDAEIHFTVVDTGQGMHEEDLRNVFDEYSRFNQFANRKTEGTGLGLNITGHLVSLMNGNISAESEFGKGSTFTIMLPLKISPDTKPISDDVRKSLEKFKYDIKKSEKRISSYELMSHGSVLVIDDIETNLYVMEGLLAPYGVRCQSVESGKKAIELIQDGNIYDIIFMDHMMPEMDGIEATNIIRALGYKGIIIALTANALAGNDVMFKENGFDDFISKPIDIRLLDKCMHSYIKNNSQKEESDKSNGDKGKNELDKANNELDSAQKSPAVLSPGLINVFLSDAEKMKKLMSEQLAAKDLKAFSITVHGIKSACANIGEKECSRLAEELELAAKENNLKYVMQNYPSFEKLLKKIILKLTPAEDEIKKIVNKIDIDEIKKYMTAICKACDEYDSDRAMGILSELQQVRLTKELRDFFFKIHNDVLHSDFEEAAQKCREYKL